MREIFVEKSFKGKSVLVTGATGFLGKVLVEKLLRSCRGVEKIFIILRPKKGDGLDKRFNSFKNSVVFDVLRKSHDKALEKLIVIEGNLMESPAAGISEKDLQTLKESVSFVIHCAATVKFDEPFKTAITMNTIGTRNLINLAENFNKLEAFVHVSTAFANTNQKVIFEKIYNPVIDYKVAIDCVETSNDIGLEELQATAMTVFPNTYVISKNLTEQLVRDCSSRLPIAIVRPSIVCPSFEEPHIGWVDSINGPMGVLIGASSGLIRTVHGNGDIVPDLIPCDYVVNSIIVAAASVASSENKELKIYNCTSSKQQPISWNQFLELSREIYKDFPSTKVVWFPGGRMCANYTFYWIYFALFQMIPALIIDLFLLLSGRKTWVVRLQKRIFSSLKVFEYFLKFSWEWENKNFVQLHNLVSHNERSVFNFDVETLDYKKYIVNWVIGSRRFLLKLEDRTIPEAKKKYRMLFWLNSLVQFLFLVGGLYSFSAGHRRRMREIFVKEAFVSKSVLVTGATGFIGKVLVEKLLRSCKGVEKVYILLRVKKDENVLERFETFKKSDIFDNLRRSDPRVFLKLVPIEGDLEVSPFAGISNKKLESFRDNINFIFHCAALTKSNKSMETALAVNLIGTQNILNVSERFTRLEAFVHISSAFTNLKEVKVFEEIYKPFYDYKKVIEHLKTNAIDEIKYFRKIALKAFPNSYLASKNLAEHLILDYSKRIPTAIVRPSIVGPTYQEPMRGWGDNFSGAKGLVTGVNSGFVRSINGSGNASADLIPCDYAVNAIIASAASVASSANKDLKIYNCTSSKMQLPMTWNEFMALGREVNKDYPTTKAVWFPANHLNCSYLIYLICFTCFQLLPSYFIDIINIATGKQAWAVALQKRIFNSQKNFGYLMRATCEWDNANFELLYNLISINERKCFNFEVSTLDYRDYVVNWTQGARKFLLKVDDGNLPSAKKLYKVLFLLDFLVKKVFYAYVGFKIYCFYFASSNESS